MNKTVTIGDFLYAKFKIMAHVYSKVKENAHFQPTLDHLISHMVLHIHTPIEITIVTISINKTLFSLD